MGTTSGKSQNQAEISELVALMAGLGRLIHARAGNLETATEDLIRTGRVVKTRDRRGAVADLQESFRVLTHCTLLIEAETGRLVRIAGAGAPETKPRADGDNASETL